MQTYCLVNLRSTQLFQAVSEEFLKIYKDQTNFELVNYYCFQIVPRSNLAPVVVSNPSQNETLF